MPGRKLLYPVYFPPQYQCYSRCRIYNDRMLFQGTIHQLSGERRWFAYEVFHEFAPCIPMVLMAFVQNCVCHLPNHRMTAQGLIGIAAECWVSWWLGVRGGPISRRRRECHNAYVRNKVVLEISHRPFCSISPMHVWKLYSPSTYGTASCPK